LVRQFRNVLGQPLEEAKEQVFKLGFIAAGSCGFLNALSETNGWRWSGT